MRKLLLTLLALTVLTLSASSSGLPVGGGPVGGTGAPQVGRSAFPFAACFVDPANSSTHASDLNSCATALVPIRTTTRLNALIFNTLMGASATVTYLSDDASGTLLDYSTVMIPSGVILTFQGTPQVTHTGGTLNAGTVAINPAAAGGGQAQIVHTSDLATFAPFVFSGLPFLPGTSAHPQYLLDTTGGNNGTSAWVMNTGSVQDGSNLALPDMSRPMTSTQLAAGTLTSGDSYKIQRGSTLAVAGAASSLGTTSSVFDVDTNVVFRDFAFTSSHVGMNGATYYRCSLDGPLLVGGSFRNSYLGADVTQLALPAGTVNLDSGALITVGGAGELMAPFNLSGDPYITGSGFDVQNTAYQNVFIAPGIGSGIQIQRVGAGSGMHVRGGYYELGSDSVGTALIWGKSNFVGILIGAGAGLIVSNSVPPTVTGSTQDFEFLSPPAGGVVTVARAWDDSVGAYTTTRTTTWAHFTATIAAGGFSFNAHNVSGNSSIIGD